MSEACQWHAGFQPIDEDELSLHCQYCGRILYDRQCSGCQQFFLDYSEAGHDDVMARPAVTSSGDLCCAVCLPGLERDEEIAEECDVDYDDDDLFGLPEPDDDDWTGP